MRGSWILMWSSVRRQRPTLVDRLSYPDSRSRTCSSHWSPCLIRGSSPCWTISCISMWFTFQDIIKNQVPAPAVVIKWWSKWFPKHPPPTSHFVAGISTYPTLISNCASDAGSRRAYVITFMIRKEAATLEGKTWNCFISASFRFAVITFFSIWERACLWWDVENCFCTFSLLLWIRDDQFLKLTGRKFQQKWNHSILPHLRHWLYTCYSSNKSVCFL